MYEDNCLCIIGWGKNKKSVKSKASELYKGTSFVVRRNWAITNFKNWCILSAKYGILLPDEIVEPYDLILNDLTNDDQDLLFKMAVKKIKKKFVNCSIFYIVAPSSYMRIGDYLSGLGQVIFPLKGMQGRSGLHWMRTGNSKPVDVDKVLNMVTSRLNKSEGYTKEYILSLIKSELPEYSPTYFKRILNSSTIDAVGEKGLKFRRVFEIHDGYWYLADTYIVNNPNKKSKRKKLF